jgi:aminopeptidase
MFDDRLYKRGALTLHAVRRTLGDGAFFQMLRDWTTAHRFGSVSTQLFMSHVERSDQPLRPPFTAGLYQAALPTLLAGRRLGHRSRTCRPD